MATPSSVGLSQVQPRTGNALHPANKRRYLRGFGNLLRHELQGWWGTRRWWVHLLLWLGLINGFIALISWVAAQDPGDAAAPIGEMASILFFQFSLISISIGAIITAQGSIIGEKQRGTAAWILSKPVSRTAFVLAKLVAHALSYTVLAVAIPSVVFVVQMAVQWDRVSALVPFLLSNGLAILNLVFYLALTLLLGTVFAQRGPVAGVALGFLLGGNALRSMLPAVAQVTPLVFPDLAGAIAQGGPMPPNAYLPVLGTAVSTALFIGATLWRFNREEF